MHLCVLLDFACVQNGPHHRPDNVLVITAVVIGLCGEASTMQGPLHEHMAVPANLLVPPILHSLLAIIEQLAKATGAADGWALLQRMPGHVLNPGDMARHALELRPHEGHCYQPEKLLTLCRQVLRPPLGPPVGLSERALRGQWQFPASLLVGVVTVPTTAGWFFPLARLDKGPVAVASALADSRGLSIFITS